MPARQIDPFRRILAGCMAMLIGFGPTTPALAALTNLADGPINVSVEAKPNIVFTLDDSTSMNLDFLPDYMVVNTLTNAATTYCRSATGLTGCGNVGSATMPQYHYAEWLPAAVLGAAGSFPFPAGYGGSSYGPPAMMAANFNAMFYNPLVTYTAPKKYDGTSYNDMNATTTTNWTQVPADPFLFPAKYVNLQTKVNVGVWCNTTYAGAQAVLNGITIGGNHCRINGYPYAAGPTGAPAPAVAGDYNYPYSRNTGSTALSNFFDKTTRTIHCDPNRMNGTTPSGKAEVAPTAPTCDACPLSCPVTQVEDPSSPAGCDLGCTNPAECTKCNLMCPVAKDYLCTTSCTTPALSCPSSGNSWAAQPKSCTPGPNEKCTTHPGSCATTGTWTLDSAACTTVINGKSKTQATDPVPATVIGKTYDQDANGAGFVCRRNNFTYGATVADGWTYPSGSYTTAVTSSCGTITASINRHYYRAAVQWCDAQLPTAGSNDKWRGYGKGTCQAEKTSVYQYPKFVKFNVDVNVAQDNYTDPAFELVELDYVNKRIIVRNGTPATTITHNDDSEDPPIAITRDDVTALTPDKNELVNYANWFAYYRTRMLAAKTVTSLAFSDLTDKFRVGFHTLSNTPATDFLTIADFVGGAGNHRANWYGKLTGVKVPMGNDTPLLTGISRIGDWFMSSTGTSAALSGSTDPITLSCQKNYHILFTDGYTNQASMPATSVGNIDGVNIPASTSTTMPEAITDLVPGTPWPKPIKEGVTAVSDSLADYALYYWMKDLRPPTFPAAQSENNVPTSGSDPAKWQHLNFAGLSLGTEGVLPSRDPSTTEAKIVAGTLNWTTPAPTVNRPGVTGVDDLWHASLVARSQFVNARDPAELREGMEGILDDITMTGGTRAGAAFTSVNFSSSGNYVYRVRTEPGWGGTLTKIEVKADGSGEEAVSTTKYHEVLAAQVTPATSTDEPWYDNRRVITKTSPGTGGAVPFRLANLAAAGKDTTLGATATIQKKIVDYLRGDRSNEGTKPGKFRVRNGVLGDIVNSSPVVVGAPNAPFSNATDPNYETFKSTQAGRKKMLYVGANDGMLHAFDEAAGTELWAYVPSFAYSSLPDKGLAMLAKRGKFFKHQMFVDSTPVVADVDIGGTWKTVLIGGLGKGGKGFYAIDVTDPGSITTETDAAARVMWEFTDTTSGNELGYSYGKPLIAKTYAHGWVAVVSSGHNAGGKGRIYVLKLSDGTVLKQLDTSEGTTAIPSGLAQISGFVLSYKNQYLEQIYGGDLLGNVWRFDVSNASPASWTVDKLATLNIGGVAQSVTMAPQIEVDIGNGVDRYVMVGTGRLLHESDLVDYAAQQQTMYVIRDGSVLAMNTAGLPHDPRSDAAFSPLVDLEDGFSGLTVKGWYHDLPLGERIVTPIAAELGFVGYAGSLPPTNECIPGLSANVYVRQFANGKNVVEGTGFPYYPSPDGAVGMDFVNIYQADPTYPTLKLAITLGSDGTTKYISLEPPPGFGDHRMSWRLLGR